MKGKRLLWSLLILALPWGGGCMELEEEDVENPWWWELPYAREVVSFQPGTGAGYGAANFPDVVLGPPQGRGSFSGSLDVLSLGAGGEIILSFQGREIVNGEGVDFVVFENPFWPDGDPEEVFAELGEVSVSLDGESWHVFECSFEPEDAPPYRGCAGWTPTLRFEPEEVVPLELELTGGDGFDLSQVGLERARYVRIRDLWGVGESPTRGFDLDGVGLIHFEEIEGE